MNWLKAIAVTMGPRLIGIAAGSVASLVFAKTRGTITLDPQQITEMGTTLLIGYAGGHRIASSFINPGDAAKGRLAAAEKDAVTDGTTVKVQGE